MPAKTEKQARFMRAVANSPEFAKKAGVPQSVGKEFTMKGKKTSGTKPVGMKKGGSVDGVAKKGKTHTAMVKMAKGGKVR